MCLVVFFLRLLKEASGNAELDKWVRDYVVLDFETAQLKQSASSGKFTDDQIPLVEVTKGLKLISEDYCNAVLSSFIKIDDEHKRCLVWHGLFLVYYHSTIHKLASRATDLEEIRDQLSDITTIFNDDWEIGIIFKDVISSYVQFGHIQKSPDTVITDINWMIGELRSRESKNMLAACLSGATTAFSFARASYDKKKEIISIFDDEFGERVDLEEETGTEFVAATVALMHGFYRNRENFEFALELAKRSELITHKFPNDKNVENLNMALGQLARRESDIASVEEADEFLTKTVSLANKYGKQVPKIVQTVVREISSKYSNEIKHDYEKAQKYFEMTVDLCDSSDGVDLGDNKLFLGGLLEGEFGYALRSKNFNTLRDLTNIINNFQQHPAVDISHFWPSTGELLRIYQAAKQSDDKIAANEIASIAEYWCDNLIDNSSVKGVFSHIVQDNKRLSRNE